MDADGAATGRLFPARAANTLLIGPGLALPLFVIWSVHYLPQVDTPNHLARHYLEALHFQGEPLPGGYEIEYRLLPNLGGDLVIPWLMMIWSPLTAGKIFVSLAAILYWLGPALFILQEGDGKPGAWAASLLWLPFCLSSQFFWGFLNYYSGVGLAFLVLAYAGWLNRKEQPRMALSLIHLGLVGLLFFWHLAAAFLYAVVASCRVLPDIWQCRRKTNWTPPLLRRVVWTGLTLLLLIGLVGAYLATKSGVPAAPNQWGGIVRKGRMLLTLFRGYDISMDVLAAGLWFGALLCFFGRSFLAPKRGWLVLAAGVLFLLYLVLPFQWGSTSDADSRLLPALIVVLLAWVGTLPLRSLGWGTLLLAGALIVRNGSVWHAWRSLDSRLQEAARSLEVLPEGKKILPAVLIDAPSKTHPETHFVCMAVITRNAYVPTLFAFADQQPLRLTQNGKLPLRFENGILTLEPGAAEYDYLWIYNPDRAELRLAADAVRIFSGQDIEVWRLKPSSNEPDA